MTVKELIEELKNHNEDALVAVKYRDDGGCYSGCDYDIKPFVNGREVYWSDIEEGVVIL